jgi:hypothetical protein
MPEHRELHLSEERLLLYVDGELAAEQKQEADRHLESCWQCRARYLDLQNTIRLIVEAHQRILIERRPADGWTGLARRIAQHETETGKTAPHWLARYSRWILHRAHLAGLSVVTAALLWLSFPSNHTALRAEQIVERARTIERSSDNSAWGEKRCMRLSVGQPGQKNPEQIEYEITFRRGGQRSLQILTASNRTLGLLAEARVAFERGLAWDRPTSAEAFERWRQSVDVVEERVERRPELELAVITRAKRSAERIHHAELVVLEASGRAVETAVRIGEREYKVRELDAQRLPEQQTVGGLAETRKSSPDALLDPLDLETLEMSVRHDLHHLGGDLGEPIEVYRNTKNHVCIEALGLPPT